MVFRFLHLADLHLETHFGGRPGTRERLRQATLEAFEAAARHAREEQLDAVLLAGDLFDDGLLSLRTELKLVSTLRELVAAGTSVLAVCGNHDPGGAGWRTARLGFERVRGTMEPDAPGVFWFLDTEPASVLVRGREGSARIHGAGHGSDRESDNLAATFPRAEPQAGVAHIGLLHTQVEGARLSDRHDRYAPSSDADLAAKNYDYWALGHVHQRGRASDVAPAWYSGNLQGRHGRETGPKGGLVVELRPGEPAQPRFVPFAPVRWEERSLPDLERIETLDELASAIEEDLARLRGEVAGEVAVRMDLGGRSPLAPVLHAREERESLEEELIQRSGVLDLELLTRSLVRRRDRARIESAPTVLAEALALLREAAEDDACLERMTPDELAGIGPDRIAKDDLRRAYVRELAAGLDEELFERALDSKLEGSS